MSLLLKLQRSVSVLQSFLDRYAMRRVFCLVSRKTRYKRNILVQRNSPLYQSVSCAQNETS